jgi:signal transduction histidine kinase
MAAGVLHNVRNVLAPLILRLDDLCQSCREARLEQVETAVDELADGQPSLERRADLVQFVRLATGRVSGLFRNAVPELEHLSRGLVQIEEIIAAQDRLERAQPVAEPLRLDELVRDAIALTPPRLRETIRFDVDPGLTQVGLVGGERVVLLQVFANLLANAREAVERLGTARGRIRVAAEVERTTEAETIHVRVCDNGEGIAPAHLGRIFERGFSTKPGGSSGLGLHWCANTVNAMGGRLYAESEGPGRGACLHLLLPRNVAEGTGPERR